MCGLQYKMPLVPNGLVVEDETYIDDAIQLTVRAMADFAACPSCGASSRRVHMRLPTQSGHLFRLDSGRRTDLIPANRPSRGKTDLLSMNGPHIIEIASDPKLKAD
jgi:hypothetical protein